MRQFTGINTEIDKGYIDRLKKEKADLDEKISKLEAYLLPPGKDLKIPILQQSLLMAQLPVMKAYSTILERRLAYL